MYILVLSYILFMYQKLNNNPLKIIKMRLFKSGIISLKYVFIPKIKNKRKKVHK